jgi:hypothetical protein
MHPILPAAAQQTTAMGAILIETQPRQAIRDLPAVANRRIRPAFA